MSNSMRNLVCIRLLGIAVIFLGAAIIFNINNTKQLQQRVTALEQLQDEIRRTWTILDATPHVPTSPYVAGEETKSFSLQSPPPGTAEELLVPPQTVDPTPKRAPQEGEVLLIGDVHEPGMSTATRHGDIYLDHGAGTLRKLDPKRASLD